MIPMKQTSQMENEINNLREIFPFTHDVLDIGTGNGEFLTQLEHYDFNAVGIDKNEQCVDYGQKAGCKIYLARFPDIPDGLSKMSFDLVTFRESIYYLPMPEVFGYLRKALRPNGGIYIKSHLETSIYHSRFTQRGFRDRNVYLRKRFHDAWLPTLDNLTEHLEANGYQVLCKGYFLENIAETLHLPMSSTIGKCSMAGSLLINLLGRGDDCFIYARKDKNVR